ncbi:hypothetical protein GCM10012280_44910 [Wenjunlia tyrosinilytica]|uniref:Transposase IS4-like domain-containing protein n=1 Tax=Wenjunlia tyrosinilytica TaxID=1544741 RepID=A0A917ZSS8_9ACTN|nr:hypothetical protein GCM10012280_44910 [Wenjunlia tyrosinilytica]
MFPWPPRWRHPPFESDVPVRTAALHARMHLACDGLGRPLALVLTGGNTTDCAQFTAVMEGIRAPRLGPGRPRVRPAHVIGDKGFSSKAIRTWLRHRNIPHTVPERADQGRNRLRRGSRGGRPPAFDREVHKQRNVVERSVLKVEYVHRPVFRTRTEARIKIATRRVSASAFRARPVRWTVPGWAVEAAVVSAVARAAARCG